VNLSIRFGTGTLPWEGPCSTQSLILPYGQVLVFKADVVVQDAGCDGCHFAFLVDSQYVTPLETQVFSIGETAAHNSPCSLRDDSPDQVRYTIEGFISVD